MAAATAVVLATPKATDSTNGIRASTGPGVTIMRLSSGVATGWPSASMNTPASSAVTPSASSDDRSAGVMAS